MEFMEVFHSEVITRMVSALIFFELNPMEL